MDESVTSVRMETEELVKLQKEDEDLMEICRFLVDGSLPEDTKRAKHLVLEKERSVVTDKVLYYVDRGEQHRL